MNQDAFPPTAPRVLTEDRVKLLIHDSVTGALSSHENKIEAMLAKHGQDMMAMFASAFPDGDPHGHRIAHEDMINEAHGWRKLKQDVVSKFMTAGLWAAAVFLAVAIWQHFLSAISK